MRHPELWVITQSQLWITQIGTCCTEDNMITAYCAAISLKSVYWRLCFEAPTAMILCIPIHHIHTLKQVTRV